MDTIDTNCVHNAHDINSNHTIIVQNSSACSVQTRFEKETLHKINNSVSLQKNNSKIVEIVLENIILIVRILAMLISVQYVSLTDISAYTEKCCQESHTVLKSE